MTLGRPIQDSLATVTAGFAIFLPAVRFSTLPFLLSIEEYHVQIISQLEGFKVRRVVAHHVRRCIRWDLSFIILNGCRCFKPLTFALYAKLDILNHLIAFNTVHLLHTIVCCDFDLFVRAMWVIGDAGVDFDFQ